MLTSKQRAQLRGMANSFDVIIHVGKGGINDMIVRQTDDVLECRELVKGGVLETAPISSREAADLIAERVGADVVQVIGRKFVLYRESKENKQIKLVK